MKTEQKIYSNYEEIKVDYMTIAQNFEFACLEINNVFNEIDDNNTLTVDDISTLLHDQKEKIAKAYLEYQAIAQKSIDILNISLKALEDKPLSETFEELVAINEEKDQINKEIDFLNEYYDDANNTIDSYIKKFEASLDSEYSLE